MPFARLRLINDEGNCGGGLQYGTVRLLSVGQGIMFRTFKHFFLSVLMVLCMAQFLGTACSDDCLREWSPGPLDARDHIPSGTDGPAETDGSQGEGEMEFTLAQGDGLQVIPRTGSCFFDSPSCPRQTFVSDWFRPPLLV